MMQKNMSNEIPFVCICVHANAEETFAYVYVNMDENAEAFILGSPGSGGDAGAGTKEQGRKRRSLAKCPHLGHSNTCVGICLNFLNSFSNKQSSGGGSRSPAQRWAGDPGLVLAPAGCCSFTC